MKTAHSIIATTCNYEPAVIFNYRVYKQPPTVIKDDNTVEEAIIN